MNDAYLIMSIAWVVCLVWITIVIFGNRKVHPKILFWLFMVELWERFSYYGMRALLILYLTSKIANGGFGIEEKPAYGIYGAYGALVYLTPLLGGFLADKFLGFRKAIIWGAMLMAGGQFILATSKGSEYLLYAGLACLTMGNGFFKPNISSMIGKFYPQGDPRRDGAFTIFYMGINIGAFLAPLTCGAIGETEGWNYGFLAAGIGMLAGLAVFLSAASLGVLQNYADPPDDAHKLKLMGFPSSIAAYALSLLLIPVGAYLIFKNDIMDVLLGVIGILAIAYIIYLSLQYPLEERQRIWVIIILLLFTTIFWTFFELAGSALNLFTKKNVDKVILGKEIKTSMFQGVNALFIMIFAPLFSMMWIWLARTNREPSAPIKFALALLLIGAGFFVLNLGGSMANEGIVPAIFLILLYLLHTLGELALSPVGLSLVTKLAPAKIVGFMMGFWFLSSAIAHQAGKWIAGGTAVSDSATPQEALTKSMEVFQQVGLFAIGSGVVLILLSPIIKKWMHGIK